MNPFLRNRVARARGSSLVNALVIVAILTVVSLAFVKRGSGEGDAVAAKHRYDRSLSCSDAALELLQSQFRAYGTSPTLMVVNQQASDQTLATGHYDNIAVASVVAAPGFSSSGLGVSDLSNRLARTGLGGQVYRMTVVCSTGPTDAATNQTEVEFVVRFGL